MNTYKMRAECLIDVVQFLTAISVYSYVIESTDNRFGDVTIEFTCPLDVATLKENMATIQDGHVMLETVALESDYTGE